MVMELWLSYMDILANSLKGVMLCTYLAAGVDQVSCCNCRLRVSWQEREGLWGRQILTLSAFFRLPMHGLAEQIALQCSY
jgi:hypothetical protein